MFPRFSVIIPVYNAENTLRRCLDSLVQQSYEDYEILLVNDGSADQSGQICESYAKEYPQIRFFQKENGGVSTARNMGLDHASGEYILFVDSDDYVSNDYFHVLDEAVQSDPADLIQFSACLWHGENTEYRIESERHIVSEPEVTAKICDDIRSQTISSLWIKAMKRQLIESNGIRFLPSLAIGEDTLFATCVAAKVHTITTRKDILYHVCLENGESLSRKRRDDLCEQLLLEHRERFDAIRTAEPQRRSPLFEAVCFSFYRSAYSSAKELLKYDLSRGERYKKIREICARYAQEKVKPSDWKSRLISVPVRWHLAPVIDVMVQAAAKRR